MNVEARKLVEAVRDLFYCRQDVYAEGYAMASGKIAYPPARTEDGADKPLSDEAILKHFKGEIFLGIYPLVEESKVRWLAMDFDSDGQEDPFAAAKQQKNKLLDVGVVSYIERSRSGMGAHVWIFVDELIEARIIREVARHYLVDDSTFDRMFPNQDTAQGGYGNLIALPYNGKAYKEGNSSFITDDGERIDPKKFLGNVKKNSKEFIMKLYDDMMPKLGEMVEETVTSTSRRNSLSGALKVVTFSNWMKAAKERMPSQNQEPEFYALCCQFAQLEDGERLAYEFGRLHPYSDERIAQKFEQAKRVNKPHTCQTLRDEYGWEETADIDFGVMYPYELASMPFSKLMSGKKGKSHSFKEIGASVIARTKELYKTGTRFGWPYGYDKLDDLTELRPGNLIIIGARSKIGKSSISVDITYNLNERGIPAYWASLEMTKEELGTKYLSRVSGVGVNDIRKGTLDYYDWRKVLKSYKVFETMPFYVDDETRDLDRIIDVVSKNVSDHGPGVLFLDYIELISSLPHESDSMFMLTNRVVKELKALAKILDIPIIALSNFNRKAEQDMVEDNDPMDSWLRNSGLTEQTADVILYLLGKDTDTVVQTRKLRIQKERHSGAGGKEIPLWFNGSLSRFYESPPNSVSEDLNLSSWFGGNSQQALEVL